MKKLQLSALQSGIDALQRKHGDTRYTALYGAGRIKKPRVLFLFMNPTARNLGVHATWRGMRAPWLGLKNTWKLMCELGIIGRKTYSHIQGLTPDNWTPDFAETLYGEVANNGAYLTNLARCTEPDARHVADKVFRESRNITLAEIALVEPKAVIAFGNQVASNLLEQPIQVSKHHGKKYDLQIGEKTFAVYPTYYPVGMGQMNMPKAIKDIRKILKSM